MESAFRVRKMIPNILSVLRLLLVIPFLIAMQIFLTLTRKEHFFTILTLFIVITMTDILDGYLARRWDCTSEIGAKLDVISDSSFAIFATVLLVNSHLACPEYMVIMILKLIEFFVTSIIIGHKKKNGNKSLIYDKWGKNVGIIFIGLPILVCISYYLGLYNLMAIRIILVTIMIMAILSSFSRIVSVFRAKSNF